jgi:hypothetical protein
MGIVVALLFCVACSPVQAFDWDSFQSNAGNSNIQQSTGFGFSSPASAVSASSWESKVSAVAAAYKPAAAPVAPAVAAPTVYIAGAHDNAVVSTPTTSVALQSLLANAQGFSVARPVAAGTVFSLQAGAIGSGSKESMHLQTLTGSVDAGGFSGYVLNKENGQVYSAKIALQPTIDVDDSFQTVVGKENNIAVSLTPTVFAGKEATFTQYNKETREVIATSADNKELKLTIVYSPGAVQTAADNKEVTFTAATSYAVSAGKELYRIDNCGSGMMLSKVSLQPKENKIKL